MRSHWQRMDLIETEQKERRQDQITIRDLVERCKRAEARAEAAERENAVLRARLGEGPTLELVA